jgi:2-phospho-L-lactate/phosphoenolpyruvate guanylyltransferase
MKLHAIVPVKALERAKSRLAATLAPAERRLLVLEMLGKVLLALDRSPAATVWVVSADPAVLAFARARGAMPLLERNGELNEAPARAAGAEAIVVVPADVPLIAPADIAALAALLGAAHVAIAPDAAGKGTNALALRLDPQLPELPFAFGADSAERHLQSAAERGLIARSYRSPTLALDVDDAASLASYRARLAEPACTAVG